MKNLNLFAAIAASLLTSFSFCQNGTLDNQFGTGGIVTTSFPGDNDGEAVAIQDDGKIVLVGTTDDPSGNLNMRVIRYLYDGSIDNSFGNNGTVLVGGSASAGSAVTIQPDGKIVAVGTSDGASNDFDILIVRLNADGSFDTSFGVNGNLNFNYQGAEYGQSVLIQDDGKIIVGGTLAVAGELDAVAFRFNENGLVDNSFGNQGAAIVSVNGTTQFGEDCLLQDDGKIVLIGSHIDLNISDVMVSRLNSDGTVDNTFGTNGVVLTDITLGNDEGSSGALQLDGKILVTGSTEINSGPLTYQEFITLRYNTDGTLDNTFNGSGYVTGDLDGGSDVGTSIAVQSNGSIVVAGDGIIDPLGDSTSQIGMFRYLPDGTLDNTFGIGGKVITAIGMNEDLCNNMTLQDDTLILLVGETADAQGESDFALLRYSNGTIGVNELQMRPTDLSVFPNPVNPNSVISYFLNQNERVSIDVYDPRGTHVQSILKEENQSKGEHEIQLALKDDLPQGMYLLKLKSDSGSMSIEVLK